MIAVAVPPEVADALVSQRLAIRPGTRGAAAEIILVGITVATSTISLLQGPDTFLKLTQILQDTFGRRSGVTVQITARGEKVSIELPAGADVVTVARRIQDALTEDDD